MECDQDFGVIEKTARKNQWVFIPDHCVSLDAKASRKFMVTQMTDNDFITLNVLRNTVKESVKGLRNMQWLHFEKRTPLTMFFKESLSEAMEPFKEIDMKANRAGRNFIVLPSLTCNQQKPKLKYKDLQGLLMFVPPVYHAF